MDAIPGTDSKQKVYCDSVVCTGVACDECMFHAGEGRPQAIAFEEWNSGLPETAYGLDIDAICDYFTTLPDPLPSLSTSYKVVSCGRRGKKFLLALEIEAPKGARTLEVDCDYDFPPVGEDAFEIDGFVESVEKYFESVIEADRIHSRFI